MDTSNNGLVLGRDLFTRDDIYNKAAACVGLAVHPINFLAESETFKGYFIDKITLEVLRRHGIRREDRSDCNNTVYTLVDTTRQGVLVHKGERVTNYWNFVKVDGKFNVCMKLRVALEIDLKKGGVVCTPKAQANVSSQDLLCNFHMFRALVEYDQNKDSLPGIVNKIALSDDGRVLVSWRDMGVEEVCPISRVFKKLVEGKTLTEQLAYRGQVFDPLPYRDHSKPSEELYVVMSAEAILVNIWRQQLADYRNSLVL